MKTDPILNNISALALVKSKKDGKDQETTQSSTTPDSGHNIGKHQKYVIIELWMRIESSCAWCEV